MLNRLHKKFILILCTFVVISLVQNVRAETLLLDTYYVNGDSFTANGDVFFVHHETNSRIIISTSQTSLSVPLAECSRINITKLCYNSTTFDTTLRKDKVRILVYSVAPEIKLYRSITRTSFYIGDEATIITWINNTGDSPAEQVDFADEFPKAIELKEVSGGCIKENNSVVWSGSIGRNDGYECSYKIKPLAKMEQSFKAKATYYDGQKLTDAFSDAFSLTSQELVSFTKAASTTTPKLGQQVNITINVTSIYATPDSLGNRADINFIVSLPESVELSADSLLNKSGTNDYTWHTSLLTNETDQRTFYVYPHNIGKSEVSIRLNYECGAGNFSSGPEKIILDTRADAPKLSLSVITNDDSPRILSESEALESGYKYNLRVYFQNPNQFTSLKSINITFYSNLTYISNLFYPSLNQSSYIVIADHYFTAPDTDSSKTFEFIIEANSSTDLEDSFSSTLSKNFVVRPPEAIAISPSVNPSSVEAGEKATVTLSVRNPRSTKIFNVTISDSVPDALTVNGPTAVKASINPGETIASYTYTITAPRLNTEKQFLINTSVYYLDPIAWKNLTYYKESVVTVKPRDFKLAHTRATTDTSLFLDKWLVFDHSLQNNDAETVKNIRIVLPDQQYVDHEGSTEYFVEKLNPGERISLSKFEKLRVKKLSQIMIEPVTIIFEDSDGTRYNKTFSSLSLSPAAGYAEDLGPSIIVNKTWESNGKIIDVSNGIEYNGSADVLITLKNIGYKSAKSIHVTDYNYSWDLANLDKNEEVTISYSFSVPILLQTEKTGIVPINETIVRYNFGEKQYSTASNKIQAKINGKQESAAEIPAGEPVKEVVKEDGQRVIEEATDQTAPEKTSPAAKKSAWQKIKEFIIKILFWQRNPNPA